MTSWNKQQVANIVLWIAYILALAATLRHVAWAFGTLLVEAGRLIRNGNGWEVVR